MVWSVRIQYLILGELFDMYLVDIFLRNCFLDK